MLPNKCSLSTERAEFLLVTTTGQVKIIDLANGAQVILLNEVLSQVAPVFDYEKNCLIYVDTNGDVKVRNGSLPHECPSEAI